MKVMFLFQGLPHYYNYILNKLNAVEGLQVINVVPLKSTHLGAGVYQTHRDIEYKLYELEERPLQSGDLFFVGLWRVMLSERPDVIIAGIEHIRGFSGHKLTRLVRRFVGARLCLKSIPWRVPLYSDLKEARVSQYNAALKETSPTVRTICRALRHVVKEVRWCERLLGALHFPIRRIVALSLLRQDLRGKRFPYRFVDAHLNYIDAGRDIIASYGVPKERIFVTYNSPDTDRLLAVRASLLDEPRGEQHGVPRLIHVGRLIEWKRVDLLIDAVARLKGDQRSLCLSIVGDGPERGSLERQVHDVGLQDDVTFHGAVYDPHELGRLMMGSTLYVLAGVGGLSINEAMCFGLPVICSVCDGTEKHLVREGFNGLLFREGDAEDLAEKISQLLGDRELATAMGRHSLEIIQNDVNIHTVVSRYVDAFNRMTRNSQSRATS